MTSRTTLFLGDLSLFCTEKDLYRVFQSFGDIIEIKIMKSDSAKKNLSYGFITFGTFAQARAAMSAMNGFMFCGRRLRVSWAAYSNRKEPKPEHYERMHSSSVHFSYISHQLQELITEESLRRLFSNYGEVVDTSLKKSIVNQSARRQCGYGFVHYSRSDVGVKSALEAAKALKEVILDGVYFKCSISHNLEKQLVDGYLQNLLKPTIQEKHPSSLFPSIFSNSTRFGKVRETIDRPLRPPPLLPNQFIDRSKENMSNNNNIEKYNLIHGNLNTDLDDFSLFGNTFSVGSNDVDQNASFLSNPDVSFDQIADNSPQAICECSHADLPLTFSDEYFDSLDFSFMD